MLADFEEFNEYENIYANNQHSQAEQQTSKLNHTIQEMVAESFQAIQFAKEGQEFSYQSMINN